MIFEIIIGIVLGIILTIITLNQIHKRKILELKSEFRDSEKEIKNKTLSASRRSLVGKFIEKFVPFLERFDYEPSDAHFIGQPIDYIIFDGLHEDKVRKIIFLEVKSGKSKLTSRERSLKEAIENKEVYWDELRVDTEGLGDLDLGNEEDLS